jgi:flagella basal body P-ring formation protein FlgA
MLRQAVMAARQFSGIERLGQAAVGVLSVSLLLALSLFPSSARAEADFEGGRVLPASLAERVKQVALAAKPASMDVPESTKLRIEADVGALDARLQLAPCQKVDVYLPSSRSAWSQTRVGLRCMKGSSPWHVFVSVQVRAWGSALVAAGPLPLGRELQAKDFVTAEVDWAEHPSAAFTDHSNLVGRQLQRSLSAGESLRSHHLKPRQWFAAGEAVKVRAVGAGFAVGGMAEAITPGIEGQPARVRTESGRILVGQAVAERLLEINL